MIRSVLPPLTVLVLNDAEDAVGLLCQWFTAHGHISFGFRVRAVRNASGNTSGLVSPHYADVVVPDVAFPYSLNWFHTEMFKMANPSTPLVVTTPNRAALESLVGPTGAFELTGSRENLTELLRLVHAACGRDGEGHIRTG